MKNEEFFYIFVFLHYQTTIDISKIHLIKGEFKKKLDLLFTTGVKAGFPSPAGDYLHEILDFNRDLIKHPEATFYGRVDGDSMEDAGICDGDIAVIGRSLTMDELKTKLAEIFE